MARSNTRGYQDGDSSPYWVWFNGQAYPYKTWAGAVRFAKAHNQDIIEDGAGNYWFIDGTDANDFDPD